MHGPVYYKPRHGVNALHYGDTRKPLALVVPDKHWPGMYRIAWPDGRLSDIANLSRAKDAAEAICERGPPRRNPQVFGWRPVKPVGSRAQPRPCV